MFDKRVRAEIAEEYPGHLARVRICREQAGRHASDCDITSALARYSDSLCASWLLPSSDAADLRQILLSPLPRSNV
ncbi:MULTISPECIES: hypothetical protein [Burkholderia]|uniref:hypothetical protein n=1 Tax=Burkholderia TaxID=32008 RepID=UPI0011800560|nr:MULTISPECIES: hypothetical protein [Burkholderia]